MCLAIPAKIIAIDTTNDRATVSVDNIQVEVSMALVDDVIVGDYVLVHVGYALNKIDLLPYVDFDVEKCIQYAKQVNPRIKILQLSAKSGAGIESWVQWLNASRAMQLVDYARTI